MNYFCSGSNLLPQSKALHGINQGIILTVVRSGTDDFIFKDFTFGSYTHSTSEPAALPLRVTVVVRFIYVFGYGSRLLPLQNSSLFNLIKKKDT